MVGDRADAMLEAMDEGMHETRHEGKYRRVEVITGRRQRRNWTDEEKARILAESAEPDVNISAIARRWGVNRGLLNVWRREAGLTSRRSAQAGAQQAMVVPVTVVGDRTSSENSPSDVAHYAAGRIEIEIAGARMTVIGSVAPELAQGSWQRCEHAGDWTFAEWREDHGGDAAGRLPARHEWACCAGGVSACG